MNNLFAASLFAAAVALLLTVWLLWRARQVKLAAPPVAKSRALRWVDIRDAARWRYAVLERAVRYVLARRDWRYRSSWILLMGLSGDGKSSLAASLPTSLLRSPLRRDVQQEKYLSTAVAGTQWHFLNQGVLIDPAPSLSAAATNAAVDQRWRAMLSDVDSLRPDRGLDGIVWVISATRLMAGNDALLTAAARYAFSCINEVQERFAFALPVYVVVSQCDTVQGFAAFWAVQDAALGREMVGWSSPTIDDNGLPTEWVDKAFVKLTEGLRSLVLKSAATHERIANVDDFFLFPQHISGLQSPLKQFMAIVFKPNVYETRAFCRGIYFTGALTSITPAIMPSRSISIPASNLNASTSPAAAVPGGAPRHDVAFVEGLIRDKVFAEQRLAQRVQHGVLARNRLVRRLQLGVLAMALLLAAALPWTSVRLAHQTQMLRDAVVAVSVNSKALGQHGCLEQDRVYALIDQVATLGTHTRYAAIPLSWVDRRINHGISDVVSTNALRMVVLPSLGCWLQRRIDEVTAATLRSVEHESAAAASARTQQQLQQQLATLSTLEDNLARFNRLAQPATVGEKKALLADLATLSEYIYGKPLPGKDLREGSALADALVKVDYADMLRITPALRERLIAHFDAMTVQAHDELLARVGSGVPRLSALQTEKSPSLERLRDFNGWLSWVQGAWILSTPRDNPCSRLGKAIEPGIETLIRDNHYPAALRGSLEHFDTQRCYQPAVDSLRTAILLPYGALFVVNPNSHVLQGVSPGLASEAAGLKALADTSFMQVQAPQPFSCNGQVNGWESGTFDEILAQLREYQLFASRQKNVAPDASPGQPLYDRLARTQLQLAIQDSLARHQRKYLDDDGGAGLDAVSQLDRRLSTESAAMSSALGPLLQALQQLRQLRMAPLADTIGQCARNYASSTLLDVSGLASASQLYDPAMLSGQGADTPLFDLGSTPVLQAYLDRQLIRTQVLAGYAAPFVTLLKNSRGVDSQRLNSQTDVYWDNTISELNQAVQFAETAGQVAKLDDFFLKQLDVMTSANCAQTLNAYRSPAGGNDFFSIRRDAMERVATLACNGQGEASSNLHYYRIAILFNTEMAGRYPFGGRDSHDLSLATVKAFFVYYAKEKPELETYLATAKDAQALQMKTFIAQLDAVEAFFADNLSAMPQSTPVAVRVGFRAMPDQSPLSNQLIAMSLTSGTDKAVWPGVATVLSWSFGQPLSLDLQWANSSRYMPLPDAAQSDLGVNGYHAVFETAGPWALLRLLDAHRPLASTANALDPAQQLLQFNVPVVQTSASGSGSTEKASFYLTLKLSADDPLTKAPVPLTVPRFPQSAPELEP